MREKGREAYIACVGELRIRNPLTFFVKVSSLSCYNTAPYSLSSLYYTCLTVLYSHYGMALYFIVEYWLSKHVEAWITCIRVVLPCVKIFII